MHAIIIKCILATPAWLQSSNACRLILLSCCCDHPWMIISRPLTTLTVLRVLAATLAWHRHMRMHSAPYLYAQAHSGAPISPTTARPPAGFLSPPDITADTQPGALLKQPCFQAAPPACRQRDPADWTRLLSHMHDASGKHLVHQVTCSVPQQGHMQRPAARSHAASSSQQAGVQQQQH